MRHLPLTNKICKVQTTLKNWAGDGPMSDGLYPATPQKKAKLNYKLYQGPILGSVKNERGTVTYQNIKY